MTAWRSRLVFVLLFGAAFWSGKCLGQVPHVAGEYTEFFYHDDEAKNRITRGPFSIFATESKYGVRLFEHWESASQTEVSVGSFLVSDFDAVYSALSYGKGTSGDAPTSKLSLATFRPGSFSNLQGRHKLQVLSLAFLLARGYPETVKHDVLPPALTPEVIAWRAGVELCEVRNQITRQRGKGSISVTFWGIRPGAAVTKLANGRDCFVLASLEVSDVEKTLPKRIIFCVYRKKPGADNVVQSVLRTKTEFVGELTDAGIEVFSGAAYEAEGKVHVSDHRLRPGTPVRYTIPASAQPVFASENRVEYDAMVAKNQQRAVNEVALNSKRWVSVGLIAVIPLAFFAVVYVRLRTKTKPNKEQYDKDVTTI